MAATFEADDAAGRCRCGLREIEIVELGRWSTRSRSTRAVTPTSLRPVARSSGMTSEILPAPTTDRPRGSSAAKAPRGSYSARCRKRSTGSLRQRPHVIAPGNSKRALTLDLHVATLAGRSKGKRYPGNAANQ